MHMRLRRLVGLAVWLAAVGYARAQAPPSPYAAVSGVVLNDVTGAPLRRAMVTLYTLDTPPLEALTYSESNGAFGFTMIPPGKYRLHVDREGFEHAWFGASTPNRAPGTLVLQAGDVRYGITFRLRPLGAISGTVLDPDGDPLPNTDIRLLKATYERRRLKYRAAGWASTDDRGHYELQDVVPGQYVVMAADRNQPAWMASEAAAGSAPPARMYAAQFYPDTSRLSAAAPLQLGSGQDLDSIDFHLVAQAVALLRGRIIVPEDLPDKSYVQVSAYPQDVPDSNEQVSGSAAFPPEFNFEVHNLIPGPYAVVATLSTPEHGLLYRTVQRIDLPAGGMDVALPLERSMDLAGRVDLEGGGERPAEPLHVTLISGDSPRVPEQPQAEVKPDGAFVIPDVPPGIWDIGVRPIPHGGYLKAMRLGDEDVLTEDMVITPATHEPLRIVVSTRGAVVSGTVKVPAGVERSARAVVLLAPSGKFEHVLSFYAQTPADDTGHFEFQGVTPGRYKLYAFEELDPPSYEDPNFLKPFEKRSQAFEVSEGQHVSRDVPLIPEEGRPGEGN
jgi:Carboxypeptidase regulatory-like domain